MNPALPLEHFVPDGEARVFPDGRLYLYGSYDISGESFYCSREYHVFSTADLEHWTDHGVSFTTHGASWGPEWDGQTLFAPDCIQLNGHYRLFFCTAGNGEGVATSTRPEGPFTDPRPVAGAHGDAIDPAGFVDDDGAVYYYWGQFHARGARLLPDLSGIDPSTLSTDLINEEEHGFHEGPSVRKRNGIYYLVYADISRGRPTSLGYATAAHPLGPFTKRGIIIDNTGCDPETWNNHGSIAELNGSWYVFYHRSSQASNYNRRLCIEPITFNRDGTINEVEMTTNGAGPPLDPQRELDASRACLLRGHARAEPLDPTVHGPGQEVLARITHDDAACYRYFRFTGESGVRITAGSATYGGTVEIRLDEPDGELMGSCEIRPTGGWTRFSSFQCPVKPVSGIHAVWLVFRRAAGGKYGRLFDLRSISFQR